MRAGGKISLLIHVRPQLSGMSLKGEGSATDGQNRTEWSGGASWIAYPDEAMQRASHVLDGPEGQWIVDPVDAEGLDEWLAERGDVRGVVLLLDRHKRDAAAIADRHGVSVSVPEFMEGVRHELQGPVETIGRDLPDSDYGVHELIDNPFWKEAVLYSEETGTLVVPEAVGTADFFRASGERLGVSLPLRLKPPRKLGRLKPERILVGHGPGIFEDADETLEDALSGARRRAPRVYADAARDLLL